MASNLYKIQLSGPTGSGADQPIQDFLGRIPSPSGSGSGIEAEHRDVIRAI